MFHEFDIAKPTVMNLRQSVFFFVISFFFVLHCLFNVVDIAEWRGFYAMTAVWVTASAVNLSKMIRDRNYANIFSEVHDEDLKYYFMQVASICEGSMEYRVFVWFSSVVSLILLFAVIWAWDFDELRLQSKAFITISLFWWWVSTIHLAQFLKNRTDPVIALQLKQHQPFQIMVIISCILSYGMLVWMLIGLDLKEIQRFYVIVGWGFSAFGLCLVSKHVTDRQRALYLFGCVDLASLDELQPTMREVAQTPSIGTQIITAPEVERKPIGRSIQQIDDFYAPAQHRGTAAQLMGQRLPNGASPTRLGDVNARFGQDKPPELWPGLPTE